MRLDVHLTISAFELPAKTQEADLVERETIVGRFAKIPLVIPNPVGVCEEFANSHGTPSEILEFTEKYGPLMNSAKPDQTFVFQLCDWRARHECFCSVWEATAKTVGIVAPGELEKYWPFPKGSRLTFSRKGIALQQDRFFDLINLCFLALPWERVRFCPAEGCERPFFIATHLRQRYCKTRACKEWGNRKRKLEHWNRNKGLYLAERKAKRSKQSKRRRSDGSGKTR